MDLFLNRNAAEIRSECNTRRRVLRKDSLFAMRVPMLDPASNSSNILNRRGISTNLAAQKDRSTYAPDYAPGSQKSGQTVASKIKKTFTKRRSLPKNFLLKRLDARYWKRLFRYFYIRFLRMSSSPEAIARGVAAGMFAGSFPLMGLQIIIGVAVAAAIRGNKAIAAASTWISNPLTYVPLFWLNFQVGRWLLRLPATTEFSFSSSWNLDAVMHMGLAVVASLMVGSLVVGLVASAVGYFLGLAIARRVQHVRHRRKTSR